jgi:hypothetical protein
MIPRYGILVQMAQLLAQLFLDWCKERDEEPLSLSITIPSACVTGLDDGHSGIKVTITTI